MIHVSLINYDYNNRALIRLYVAAFSFVRYRSNPKHRHRSTTAQHPAPNTQHRSPRVPPGILPSGI